MAQESPDSFLDVYGTPSADPSAFLTDNSDSMPHPDSGARHLRGSLPIPRRLHSGREWAHHPAPETYSASSCGGFPRTAPVLAFARATPTRLDLELDPCSMWVFPDPLQELLDLMTDCPGAGGSCPGQSNP